MRSPTWSYSCCQKTRVSSPAATTSSMAGTRRADHAAPPAGGTRQRTVASPGWCNFRGLIRWIVNVVRSLKFRGLDGVRLVIFDAHSDLKKAIRTVFGVPVLSGPGAHISQRAGVRMARAFGSWRAAPVVPFRIRTAR
ncbi:hypothetical protein E3T39_07205 [Cryobacterium suzukii]|uniref:Uncharacterized protein n=1 Tax=Cryobacterium suzukii TaxID=1259198 RepID=A0A4R9AH68_9MICO|nr:hypothetical protein E3T39_07205 [Cryobacterium suzukii]